MNKFSLKKSIERIEQYMARSITKNDMPPKDFYNMYTGKLNCGTCRKTMSPFRALFHFHL